MSGIGLTINTLHHSHHFLMTLTDDGHHSHLVANTSGDEGSHQAHVGDVDPLQTVQHRGQLLGVVFPLEERSQVSSRDAID